ncbi:MAG: hypothetical protein ACRDP9_04815 [Kribbellaceae bacterium]
MTSIVDVDLFGARWYGPVVRRALSTLGTFLRGLHDRASAPDDGVAVGFAAEPGGAHTAAAGTDQICWGDPV